jgi:hypothetical protein
MKLFPVCGVIRRPSSPFCYYAKNEKTAVTSKWPRIQQKSANWCQLATNAKSWSHGRAVTSFQVSTPQADDFQDTDWKMAITSLRLLLRQKCVWTICSESVYTRSTNDIVSGLWRHQMAQTADPPLCLQRKTTLPLQQLTNNSDVRRR